MVYDRIGLGYRRQRRPDPRVAAQIERALNGAQSILNVGAGTGSYEPRSRSVIAVEPSTAMIAQRSREGVPCVRAVAEALPFASTSFDAAMAVLTMHHWTDPARGLSEMRRVARDRMVVLTWDPQAAENFWLTRDYLPQIRELDRVRFPSLDLFEHAEIEPVPVPRNCADGFLGAFWDRPEAYLDPQVRQSMSAFSQLDPQVVDQAMKRLAGDLESGKLVTTKTDSIDLGYRIVVVRVKASK